MASKKIGATLALDGEAQFKHAVAGANKELRNMKSSMKLVSEETKGQANTLSTLTQKHEALNNVLTAAKSKQTAVADGLSNARRITNGSARLYTHTRKNSTPLKINLMKCDHLARLQAMKSQTR